jgi:hypothetical protein
MLLKNRARLRCPCVTAAYVLQRPVDSLQMRMR